jgi:hypothetical protein
LAVIVTFFEREVAVAMFGASIDFVLWIGAVRLAWGYPGRVFLFEHLPFRGF